ncbi:MAG: formylglycine-generating enzyme family protein [Candidatus Kryptoniota bacterium]
MRPFYIREMLVTNREFLEFVKANPEWRRSKVKRIFADRFYLMNWENDTTISKGTGRLVDPSAPVTFVSWFAARAFCRWKGTELPTFDELQYAIKILNQRASDRHRGAVLFINSDSNPWEWVEDINSFSIVQQTSDVQGEAPVPLCAGAAAGFNNILDYDQFRRFSYLSSVKPDYCEPNLGFRYIIRISK